MSDKLYIGDSVYVEKDDFNGIILTTENGISTSNSIVLEPEVINSLLMYLAAHQLAEL